MVSSIVPGAAGARTLDVDTRYQQRSSPLGPQDREAAADGDRIELSTASLAAARESVALGIAHVQDVLDLGRAAMAMLLDVQSAARGQASQEQLDAALRGFTERLDSAIARGSRLAGGESIAIHAEPGSAPVVIAGVDLRLKETPETGDIISVAANARADDEGLSQAAQRSFERLQEAMGALAESMRALEAHQGFLGAVETAAGVRRDIDTDGARLMALQVRQGLEASGAQPIANVEPQAVLSLFRA